MRELSSAADGGRLCPMTWLLPSEVWGKSNLDLKPTCFGRTILCLPCTESDDQERRAVPKTGG